MKKDAGERPKLGLPPLQESKKSASAYVATFIIMAAVWCLLSGQFDAFHLSLGVLSCAIVSYLSADLLFPEPLTGTTLRTAFGFLMYLPWLLYQIWLAAVHLLYLSFHPRMIELIDPYVVRFRTRLKSDLAQVTFANSITLTPGTITIYVNLHRDFSVHAIDRFSGEALPGEMELHIARAFRED
jgi:multicomponent Na+:H+ antiporter subunit E